MWSLLDGSTELDSIVIDVKDYSGRIGYVVDDLRFKDTLIDSTGSAQNRIPNIEQFIGKLHEKGYMSSVAWPFSKILTRRWCIRNGP